jgi:hypothetical protein
MSPHRTYPVRFDEDGKACQKHVGAMANLLSGRFSPTSNKLADAGNGYSAMQLANPVVLTATDKPHLDPGS